MLEGTPNLVYYRFPVSHWHHSPEFGGRARPTSLEQKAKSAIKYFSPLFQWIEEATAKGQSVLIHCLAGAHRAGTTGVAWIMHKTNLGVHDAIAAAKQCRPIVNPFAHLLELLEILEIGLKNRGQG